MRITADFNSIQNNKLDLFLDWNHNYSSIRVLDTAEDEKCLKKF